MLCMSGSRRAAVYATEITTLSPSSSTHGLVKFLQGREGVRGKRDAVAEGEKAQKWGAALGRG